MSKMLSKGGFGCIYYPAIQCNGKPSKSKKFVSKLQSNDYTAKNEIDIGKIIKAIDKYFLYFVPVLKHCNINVSKIDNRFMDECTVLNTNSDKKFVILKLEYISNNNIYDISKLDML